MKFIAVGDVIVGLISFSNGWQYQSQDEFEADEEKHMIHRQDVRYTAADRFRPYRTWGWQVQLVMRFADKARDIVDVCILGRWS
jgi:hypothetical protein